jgi:hypothetical protein
MQELPRQKAGCSKVCKFTFQLHAASAPA